MANNFSRRKYILGSKETGCIFSTMRNSGMNNFRRAYIYTEHFNRLISCLFQAPKACEPSPQGGLSEVLYQLHSLKGLLLQLGGN